MSVMMQAIDISPAYQYASGDPQDRLFRCGLHHTPSPKLHPLHMIEPWVLQVCSIQLLDYLKENKVCR